MDRDVALNGQLEPFRSAVLADADAEAKAIRAEAQARVREIEEQGAADSAAIEARSREEGIRAGSVEAARRRAALARVQRRRVLEARREAYETIRRAAIRAVLELRDEPDYDEFEDRLARIAEEALGGAARVARDPDHVGGVRATQGSRSIDLTLPRLADGCLFELSDAIAEVLA